MLTDVECRQWVAKGNRDANDSRSDIGDGIDRSSEPLEDALANDRRLFQANLEKFFQRFLAGSARPNRARVIATTYTPDYELLTADSNPEIKNKASKTVGFKPAKELKSGL